MSQLPVAVEGMLINIQPPVQGKVTILSPPSSLSSVTGKKVYLEPLDIQADMIMLGPLGSVTQGIGKGNLPALAINSTSEAKKVMRINDLSAPIPASAATHVGGSGAPEPSTISFVVKIEDAGQTLFKSV